MWSFIKRIAGKCWNFVKKHFHKAVAVVSAGLLMVTIEILGFVAADYLLLPLAMISIIGLIGLAFAYFLVIFTAISIGYEVFNALWENCNLETILAKRQLKKDKAENITNVEAEPVNKSTLATESALAAVVAGVTA